MTTIGEYIKTKEAQAEADHHFRKTLNFWLKDGTNKLVKFARGKRGTLDYGKYVIMLVSKPNPDMVRLKIKSKPNIIILWGDFGLIARSVSHKYDNQHWKFYHQNAAAENFYKSQVRSAQH
jgi:hypothetical protein